MPEPLDGAGDQGVHLVLASHVGDDGEGLAAGGDDLRRDRVQPIGSPRTDDERRASRGRAGSPWRVRCQPSRR